MPSFLVNLLTVCCIVFLFLVLGPFVAPALYSALIIALASWKVWLLVIAVVVAIAFLVAILQGKGSPEPQSPPKTDPRLRIAPPASQAAPRAERHQPVEPAPQPEPPMQLPPIMTEAEARSARIDAGLEAWRKELERDQNSRP